MFLANALIGLREGLEAGLVVTVFAAFLAGRGRRRDMRFVWWGVAVAVLVSLAAGVLLVTSAASLGERHKVVFTGIASALAVVLVTTMIFWMRHSVQRERRQLENQLAKALTMGPLAVFSVALVAVLREGLEAAVFVLVLTDGGTTGAVHSVGGLVSGIVAAAALTWLLYTGLVRIDLARFLTVSGFLLIVLAAGILAHGVTDLQHARLLPGSGAVAFDLSSYLPADSWAGHFVTGILGLSAQPTVLAVFVWVAYAGAVLAAFLSALSGPAQPAELEPESGRSGPSAVPSSSNSRR